MKRWKLCQGAPEELDDTPVAINSGIKTPLSLEQMIAKYIVEKDVAAQMEGHDTVEEAMDFEDVDPDLIDMTPYEFEEMESDFGAPYDLDPEELSTNPRTEPGPQEAGTVGGVRGQQPGETALPDDHEVQRADPVPEGSATGR